MSEEGPGEELQLRIPERLPGGGGHPGRQLGSWQAGVSELEQPCLLVSQSLVCEHTWPGLCVASGGGLWFSKSLQVTMEGLRTKLTRVGIW